MGRHYLLEKCKTTKEALQKIHEFPIASTQTITLADNSGDIVVIECNPDQIEVITPNQTNHQFVITANRFNSPKMISL